jgi:hypothetical protein
MKATKHGMAPHLVPKTEGAGAPICRQSHVDFLLGLQRADPRALHAQRKHYDQCHLLKPEGKSETMGVCLLHDSARPHTAAATVSTIEELWFECIPHHPYSPDLAPSDFHVFGSLKDVLSGTQFWNDDEVWSATHEWLHARPKEFFSHGIYALVKQWHRAIELEGDCSTIIV